MRRSKPGEPGCWREDKLGGAVFEENVEDAILLVGLEATLFFGAEQSLLERLEGLVRFLAECDFVDHANPSVTVARAAGRGGQHKAQGGHWVRSAVWYPRRRTAGRRSRGDGDLPRRSPR